MNSLFFISLKKRRRINIHIFNSIFESYLNIIEYSIQKKNLNKWRLYKENCSKETDINSYFHFIQM